MSAGTSSGAAGIARLPAKFSEYVDLESYLFRTVQRRFTAQGYLFAFDFFCIVIWKANRAKSRIAQRLLGHGHKTPDAGAHSLTRGLTSQGTPKERLRYLVEMWKLRLPMASAILTVLYPQEFTVYDIRVCEMLGRFCHLDRRRDFERLWQGYEEFKRAVVERTPKGLSLRDRDRYLWGESFYRQLTDDIKQRFDLPRRRSPKR